MMPVLISIAWLNIIVVAFLFGLGFTFGTMLANGIVGLFRRG